MVMFDTCILIEFSRANMVVKEKILQFQPNQIFISDVTVFEFTAGARNKADYNIIIEELKDYTNIPITAAISEIFVKLGKTYALSHKLSVPDMLIASTAIYYDIPLFTINTKDFHFLPDIKLID
ncbi:MAG: type II toxin-antitoxin system VapC family toxin [Cytophagales bacterium]